MTIFSADATLIMSLVIPFLTGRKTKKEKETHEEEAAVSLISEL